MQQGDFIPRRTQHVRREGCWLGRLVAWFVVASSLFAAGAPWLDVALRQIGPHPGLHWALGASAVLVVAIITLRLAVAAARRRAQRAPRAVAGEDAQAGAIARAAEPVNS